MNVSRNQDFAGPFEAKYEYMGEEKKKEEKGRKRGKREIVRVR